MISVIIPVYNVEKYLNECLNSVCSQTFENLEIILVDDGSTDDSSKICDEWSAKDSRVRVIHQLNAGLSEARNSGLKYCKGDYILYIVFYIIFWQAEDNHHLRREFYQVLPAVCVFRQFAFYHVSYDKRTILHKRYNQGAKGQVRLSRIYW